MRVAELAQQTAKAFEEVRTQFVAVDERFDRVEDRLTALETQMVLMKEEILEAVDQRMGAKLDHILSVVEGFATRVDTQELTMTGGILRRHEGWIRDIADRNGLVLKP